MFEELREQFIKYQEEINKLSDDEKKIIDDVSIKYNMDNIEQYADCISKEISLLTIIVENQKNSATAQSWEKFDDLFNENIRIVEKFLSGIKDIADNVKSNLKIDDEKLQEINISIKENLQ